MSENNPKQWNIWTPILVFFLLSIGILIGYFIKNFEISSQSPNTTSFAPPTVVQRYDRLEEIISIIGEDYLLPQSKDSLFDIAIKSIFSNLDPYSSYIPLSEKKAFEDQLAGNFKGVGVEFIYVNDTVFLSHIIPSSPAEESDLRPGDLLIKVNDHVVSGKNLDNDQLIEYISEGGNQLKLDILRLPNRSPKTIEVKKGNVPLISIDAYYLLTNKIGYIKINRFSATTYREFTSALQDLLEDGMESLIIDLRQNPGGYLEAAVAIVDELLTDNRVIVSTENRVYGQEYYKSELKGYFEEGPLAILIDEGSASASEILAGAIQDWDRGWIIGRRSYGKGLVQEIFDLHDGSSLKLTTSKYLTPAGRDIQRPYLTIDSTKNTAAFATFKDEVEGSDKNKSEVVEDTTLFLTKLLKREIHGGGGIKPDIIVPLDKRRDFLGDLYNLLLSDVLNMSAYKYYMYHNEDIKKHKSLEAFTADFKLPESVLEQLLKDYNEANPQSPIVKWPSPQGKEYVRDRISTIIARMEYGPQGYFYYQHKKDQGVQRAIQQLNTQPYVK